MIVERLLILLARKLVLSLYFLKFNDLLVHLQS
jgi:hypothetical protein